MNIELYDGLVFQADTTHCTPVTEHTFMFEATGKIEKDGRTFFGTLLCAVSEYNLTIEEIGPCPNGEFSCPT